MNSEIKGHILIVDDEKYIGAALSDYFSEAGYSTNLAADVASARKILRHGNTPDMILLDVVMPDGDGLLLLREIRLNPKTKDIPVIMMSAHRVKSQDRVAGLEFGASDYVTKPFELREMLIRVERLIKKNKELSLGGVNEESIQSPHLYSLEKALSKIANRPPQAILQATPPTPIDFNDFPTAEILSQELPQSNEVKKIGKQILSILLEPKTAFSSWFDHQTWPLPIAVPALTALGFGLQSGIEERSLGMGIMSSLFYGSVIFGGTAAIAWIIQWILGLRQITVSFKSLWGVFCLALAPLFLTSLLGIFYVAFAHGTAFEFTASPLLILISQASSKYFGVFFRRMDLFELWSLALGALGVSLVLSTPVKKTAVGAGIFWILIVITGTVLSNF